MSNLETIGTVFRTKHPGNGAVAFHDDGRVCAIGGWDGRCVPQPPLTFLMIDLSTDDRISSVFLLLKKKILLLSKKKSTLTVIVTAYGSTPRRRSRHSAR
jgi:hypothetical protein